LSRSTSFFSDRTLLPFLYPPAFPCPFPSSTVVGRFPFCDFSPRPACFVGSYQYTPSWGVASPRLFLCATSFGGHETMPFFPIHRDPNRLANWIFVAELVSAYFSSIVRPGNVLFLRPFHLRIASALVALICLSIFVQFPVNLVSLFPSSWSRILLCPTSSPSPALAVPCIILAIVQANPQSGLLPFGS